MAKPHVRLEVAGDGTQDVIPNLTRILIVITVVLDQLRTIDKARLVRKLGRVSRPTQGKVLQRLAEMYAE